MRQDIVDVLKTSKQNLVRALIGLPSVAAARWGRIRTLLLATATTIRKEQHTDETQDRNTQRWVGQVGWAGQVGWVYQVSLCMIGRHDVYF